MNLQVDESSSCTDMIHKLTRCYIYTLSGCDKWIRRDNVLLVLGKKDTADQFAMHEISRHNFFG